MHMKAAIVSLAMPFLVSVSAQPCGVAPASAAVRSAVGMHAVVLAATDPAARPSPSAPTRSKRKPQVPQPRSSPAPRAKAPVGHTTIAPFPAPGDSSRGAAERMKLMNVPKPGVTTIVPIPPPPTPTPGTSMPPPAPHQDSPRLDPAGKPLPRFGDYVYVEELPEATVRVSPVYPADARSTGVDGTVMVQALVLGDGTVGDTRIVKSIPMLDESAAAAVRQWRFKPARTKGQPIAVWVGIPVRFTLH